MDESLLLMDFVESLELTYFLEYYAFEFFKLDSNISHKSLLVKNSTCKDCSNVFF